MPHTVRLWLGAILAILAVLVLTAWASAAQHRRDPVTTAAANQLMRDATQLQPDGREHVMLRALRTLRAPPLEPMFEKLADDPHAALKLHGLLGAAALSPDHKLQLQRIASVEDPAVVAELIGAALDDHLLNLDDAAELMTWKGLDPGVKTLIATRLVGTGRKFDTSSLTRALDGPSLGQRGLAALLLLQLGDDSMRARLDDLSRSNDPQRDAIRATLLRTMIRHNLDRGGPWAAAVAGERYVDRTLELLAIKAAMRFGQDDAVKLWTSEFTGARDMAQRLRLALVALEAAPWMGPAMYTPIIRSDDALIAQIGRTGQAVAAKRRVQEQVVALIQMGYPPANRWALSYARDQASKADAPLIELGLIVAYGQRTDHDGPLRATRFDTVASAVKALCEGSPAVAGRLLTPMLIDTRTDPWQRRAVLLGLVRLDGSAHTPADRRPIDMASIVAGVKDFDDPMASNLLTLLKAKWGLPLERSQWRTLTLLVQGGGELDVGLRTQAAWAYLTPGAGG